MIDTYLFRRCFAYARHFNAHGAATNLAVGDEMVCDLNCQACGNRKPNAITSTAACDNCRIDTDELPFTI